MRIFVTGGNGFIGSRLVRRLAAEGREVRCLLREGSDTRRLAGAPFERCLGDVRDAAAVRAGAAGCDAVVHLAGISQWEQIRSPQMRAVVLDGTRNVLAAAEAGGGLRTVFVSTVAAINGSPEPAVMDEETAFTLPPDPFVYATAKHEAEGLCRRAAAGGLPVVVVNPCEVYGPEDDQLITAGYLRDALRGWPALATRGGTAVAHVEDVAAGILLALERGRPGERYILGGENLEIRDIIALTLEIAGQRKPVLALPSRPTAWAVGLLARLGLPTPVHPDLLAHGALYWFVDSGKARRELGYTYRDARSTLADVVRWLRAAGHAP